MSAPVSELAFPGREWPLTCKGGTWGAWPGLHSEWVAEHLSQHQQSAQLTLKMA